MNRLSLDSIRVLHVDDDPEFADVAGAHLERENDRLRVTPASTASEGLDRLADEDFDCVVSDYNMPGRNGIEFLEAVRADAPDLPFILFTGKGSEEIASEAISAGVTDYLRKQPGTDQYALLANRIVNAVEATHAKQVRRRHLRAIETAHDGISIIDESGEFSYVNEAYADLYGYEPEEMVGERFELTYPDDALEVVQGDALVAMEETGYWEGETTGLRADGSTFVEDHTLVMTDEGDMICSVRDKSEREAHEQTIEGLHSAVHALMEAETASEVAEVTVTAVRNVGGHPTNVVYRYDEDADVLEPVAWTDGADDLVEAVPSVPRGESAVWTVYESGERRVFDDASAIPGRPFENTSVRSEMLLPLGDYGVLGVGSPDLDGFDEPDLGVVQTLAAHATTAIRGIRSEQRLRDEREFVTQAIETLNDVFYVVGTDGELRRWNDRLRQVSGRSDEEIGDMEMQEFFPEADRDRVVAAFEDAVESGQATFESEIQTAAGERLTYEFAGARLTDSDGAVTGVVGIGRDISRRKAQERRLERQNERLDEFASIVSHDLRNPLNVARGHLELARDDCDSDRIDAVERAHERMETLIDDVLSIAREGETAMAVEAVPLGDVAGECWASVETRDATFVSETDRTVRADRARLRQLLENCFRNAVEHGGSDVTVTVGDLNDGFYVADDGAGIPDTERDDVFDPGYSDSAQGTGLGLSIVDDVVESHGWSITVGESDGGGARFEVRDVETGA